MASSPRLLLAAFAALRAVAGMEVVSGYASEMWESARAMCPEGTWLEHCSTIPSSTQGAYPTADARGCVATAMSSPVRAVALCSHSVPFAEGRPTVVVESHKQYQDGIAVTARCGDEPQFLVSCSCHSYWGMCRKTSWLPGSGACVTGVIPKSSGRRRYTEMGSGAKVFAICRALTVVSRPAAVGRTSTAFCPPGTWVYRCQGFGSVVPSVVPSEDGRSCAAGSDKTISVTQATCGPVRTWVVRQDGNFRDNAVLSTQCSHGQKAVWCACESPSSACGEADFRPTSPFGCSKHIPGASGARLRGNAGAKIHAICEWPEAAPSTCDAVGKGRLLAATPQSEFTVRLCPQNYVRDIQQMRASLGGAWETQQVRQAGLITVRMHTGGLEVILTMKREDLYLQEITVGGNVIRLTKRKGYLPPRNDKPAEFPESYEHMPKPQQLNKRLLTAGINAGSPEQKTWFLPYVAVVAVAEAARFEMVLHGVASLLAGSEVPFFEVGASGLLPLTKNWNDICKDQGNHVERRLAVPYRAVLAFSKKDTNLKLRMTCHPAALYRTVEGSQCVDKLASESSGSGGAGSSARRLMADVASAALARPRDFV